MHLNQQWHFNNINSTATLFDKTENRRIKKENRIKLQWKYLFCFSSGDLELVSNGTRRHTRDVGTTFPSPGEARTSRQISSSSSSLERGRGGRRSPSKTQGLQKARKSKKSPSKSYPEGTSDYKLSVPLAVVRSYILACMYTVYWFMPE